MSEDIQKAIAYLNYQFPATQGHKYLQELFETVQSNARSTTLDAVKKEVEFTCDTSSPFSSDPPQHIKNRLLTFLDRIGGGK